MVSKPVAEENPNRKLIREMLGTNDEMSTESERRHAAAESEWLKILFKRFRDDSQLSNDRIYSAAKLYVPLSLVPIVALVTNIDRPRLAHVIFLAIPSLGLMLLNVVIARREKSVRDGYNGWMIAIQDELGLDTKPLAHRWPAPRTGPHGRPPRRTRRGRRADCRQREAGSTAHAQMGRRA